MLESLFNALCRIGTLFKFSNNKNCSTKAKANASKKGIAAATTGNNSSVYIGGHHVHHQNLDHHSITASQAENESEAKFKYHLQLVAHELPSNFRNRGNAQKPFITQALEKLVYDEPV